MSRMDRGPASPSVSPDPDDLLVVEDDPATAEVLAVLLGRHGFQVRLAASARDAWRHVNDAEPDVIILDLGLPDADGVELTARLAAHVRSPIIVLTADGADDRKVAALDNGAVDYVTKPFSTPELLARVRVAVRHRRLLDAVYQDEGLRIGDLVLDPAGHRAALAGELLSLTPKEFALLLLLAQNVGRAVDHRSLIEQVWGESGTMTTLRIHVNQLRNKLGEASGTPMLTTETRVGYRLLEPDGYVRRKKSAR